MVKSKKRKQDINLVNLIERFRSDERCREYLVELRWPNGVACPRCGSLSISIVIERDQYDCNSCRYQFSVTSGTIFHDSHLPLWKWFLTVYTMIESKKGVSANQIKRTVNVAYQTAWYLCHRIRAAMTEATAEQLNNVVEVDETFTGGKRKNVGHGYKGNKAIVAGAIERGKNVRIQLISGRDREQLHEFIRKNVSPETKAIYTDDWPAYKGIADHNTKHETVNHSVDEWTRGDVHTNSIENVWSLFKRSFVGSYHQLSIKHLDAYLDELEWRFNNRDNPYLFRDTLLKLIKSENLPYEKLVGASE